MMMTQTIQTVYFVHLNAHGDEIGREAVRILVPAHEGSRLLQARFIEFMKSIELEVGDSIKIED